MTGIGSVVGLICGLIECLWLSDGPAGWVGLGRALACIVLLYTLAGALLAPLFSLFWNRLPFNHVSPRKPGGLVFGLLFGSALAAVDVNRFMPARIWQMESLLADGLIAACDAIILLILLRFVRRSSKTSKSGGPRRRLVWTTGLCTSLGLVVAFMYAWSESRSGSPIGATRILRAPSDWEIPANHPDASMSLDPNGMPWEHPANPKLVVIGLDGATWSLMQPLIDRGHLPNLKQLLAGGIGGVLRSTERSFSPVVWTSLFTGVSPVIHGIDSELNARSVNRRVHALWDMLSEQGQTVLSANIPGTYPAETIQGAMLSGFPCDGETSNNLGYLYSTRPSSEWDRQSGLRIEQLDPSAIVMDGSFDLSIREKSPLPGRPAIIWLIRSMVGQHTGPLEQWLLKTYANFDVRRTADGLRFELSGCHECGFDLSAGWSPWILLERGLRPLAFRLRIIEATSEVISLYATPIFLLDPESQVFSASIAARLEPAEGTYIIEGSGWLHFREPRLLGTLAEQLFGVARERMGYVHTLWRSYDWDAMLFVFTIIDRVQHSYWSFLDPGDYPGISPPDPYPNTLPEGISREEYAVVIPRAYEWADEQIGRLLAGLPASTLVVVVSDHGSRSGPSRIPGSGIHDPDGIYIFSGAGLGDPVHSADPPLPAGPMLSLVDVVPTILPLVGMPLASDLEGVPAPFVAATLSRQGRTIAKIHSYESLTGRKAPNRQPIDRDTLQQLRSLGYID